MKNQLLLFCYIIKSDLHVEKFNKRNLKVLLLDCFNKVGHLINITPYFSNSHENQPILKTSLSSFLPNQPCKALLGIFFGTKFGPPQDCYLLFGNIYHFLGFNDVDFCWLQHFWYFQTTLLGSQGISNLLYQFSAFPIIL